MKNVWKWMWIAFGAAVLIFAVVAIGRQGAPKVSTAPYPGYQVPSFSLQAMEPGKSITLSQFAGKPLMINFWASWCPPCKAETPDLIKAYQQFGKQVQFLGVNATAQDTETNAKSFIQHHQIPYLVAFDTTNQVVNQFAVNGFPTTVFVNSQGVIVARVEGAITPQILISDLRKIAP